MAPRLQFLRPCTYHTLTPCTNAHCSAYFRFYELTKARAASRDPKQGARGYANRTSRNPAVDEELDPAQSSARRTQRIQELKDANKLEYPKYTFAGQPTSTRAFRTRWVEASRTEVAATKGTMTSLTGRVLSVRQHGPVFSFISIVHDGCELQIMMKLNELDDGTNERQFKEFHRLLQRGDHICKPVVANSRRNAFHLSDFSLSLPVAVTGSPEHADNGVLCMLATRLPRVMSPCLVPLPHKISPESAVQNRHWDLIISPSSREILVMRDLLVRHLRAHLGKVMKCVEVQTPILAANAGGATARPFATQASEFPHKELALRIAPELWLKRLVVGGMDRVFEIGTSFRNEGVDATHNPEFTTCEFYITHANLHALMNMTQNIMYGLSKFVEQYHRRTFPSLSPPPTSRFQSGYEVVEFIPAIEKALGESLPDLESETALPDLIALIERAGKDWHRSLPPNPSLPKLLDHIAAAIIEPQSHGKPLFIKHHPVCMSPLSNSFTCPTTNQHVAARAELFYNGNELANMYEEENDPFKQRAKFVAQAKGRSNTNGKDEDPAHVIDEQYLSVLESGLPPTGGWGAGIDRLVMLFSGAKRISDVLPFGNLRHVVGLASMPQHQQRQQQTAYTAPAAFAARDAVRETLNSRLAAAKDEGGARQRHGGDLEDAEEEREEKERDEEVDEIMLKNRGSNVIGDVESEEEWRKKYRPKE